VEYLGTAYSGFQRQPGKVTVQATLEEAVASVVGERTTVVGSGRTDAGAHALHQVVAFSTESALPPSRLQAALNAHLPDDIAVVEASEERPDYHPRFDAARRVYRYLIWNREVRSPFWSSRAAHVRRRLDEHAMAEAAKALIGEHDFSAFVEANDPGKRTRTMYDARCWRDGDMVIVELCATGFMRQMVRSIAGTLIRVGRGQLSPQALGSVLESRDRTRAGDTAPAYGLYLIDVQYPSATAAGGAKEKE
jgi:tRNA pseudouridine38-40 synthase